MGREGREGERKGLAGEEFVDISANAVDSTFPVRNAGLD